MRLVLLVMLVAFGVSAQVSGTVSSLSGQKVQGAAVTLAAEGGPFTTTVFTDAAGRYTIPTPAAGVYRITAQRTGYAPRTHSALALAAGGAVTVDILLQADYAHGSEREWLMVLLAILAYLGTIVLVRWNNIQWPTRRLLIAQIDNVQSRLASEIGPDAPPDQVQKLKSYLADARKEVEEPAWLSEFMFWSRGKEISAWARVHEVERQLVSFLVPPGRIIARLATAEHELRGMNRPDSVAIAERIKTFLTALATRTDGLADTASEARELLAEALANLYNHRDQKFATLMEWHNKANWLLLASILLIAFFGIAVGRNLIFAAGAAGGLLSRLARTLRRDDVPTDYGAFWTTLYLSPVFGALSAWFGLTLVVLMVDAQLLGRVFQNVDWNNPAHPFAIAIAFLLGFSERLFNSLVNALEGQAETRTVAGAPALPPGQGAAAAAQSAATAAATVAGILKAQPASTVALGGAGLQWLEEIGKTGAKVKALINNRQDIASVGQRGAQAGLTNVEAVVFRAGAGMLQAGSLHAVVVDDVMPGPAAQELRAALTSGGVFVLLSDVTGAADSVLQQKKTTASAQLSAMGLTSISTQTLASGPRTFLLTTGQR